MNAFSLLLLLLQFFVLHSAFKINRTQKVFTTIHSMQLSADEEELLRQFPVSARVFIQKLVEIIDSKEKMMIVKEEAMIVKERLSRVLSAEANTRYLKVSGDLSIRRVLEEIEQEELVRLIKKRFKAEQKRKAKLVSDSNLKNNAIPNLSKRDLWDRVLNDSSEAKDRFPNLSLLRKELPVPGILSDLFNFCSKRVHTNLPVQVFIDVDEYTPDQVKVARALCQDYPVRYIVARASDLKDSLTGECEEDLPGELLTMDQEENQSGFEEEEEEEEEAAAAEGRR